RTAAEGMVLLKNTDGLLPLASGQEVALLGVTAYNFIAGGSGSGDVNEAYSVSLEEGLTQAGFTVNETAHDIYRAHRAANEEGFQKPEGTGALFTPFSPPEMQFTADQLADIAASAQVGILTLGRNAGEGGDRKEVDDFLLSDVEQEMLKLSTEAFHAVGKPLVVVMNIGGVIETASWKDLPDAILLAWQGGQEGGNSVADILVGNENPSGKLPMTFPIQLADHASHANFPEGGENLTTMGLMTGFLFPADERPEEEKMRNRDYTHYDEGVYVGYRHFDKAALEVSYPFGFGLSYTQFAYSEPEAVNENDTITVTASVTNTGQRAGKEAIQVYVEKVGSAIDRPLQELKAFAKTQLLEPAATEQLTMQIPIRQLAYWDEEGAQWVIEPGAYRVKIGASSRDIRAEIEIEIEP
ncbi:MAG TPA: glycosyl hydrolase, partial [Cytophagales bacterium]|nr:glycosyl hydrolase [Cytophagales bacterium]